MYVLGFDYGNKNIGVALGQSISRTASPHTTIRRQKGPPWDSIEALILEWKPEHIVIGLPLNVDGEEQPITQAARQFSKTLENKFKKKYNLQFHFHDERYSSQAANDLYQKDYEPSGRKNKKQDWDRDSVAAMLILEAWFESGYLSL